MAQKEGAKPFRVAVVGLPSCSPSSNHGAGKSCLCNRFTHSAEDEFSTNHTSVLNHEDFTGPIVNSTHFIYWGQTSYTTDDGASVYFQIIEQTEFCQDGSFNVFSSAQPYVKRAFATKNLPSASGKVAYYGPDQFVDIQKYPNPEKFPDKFQIDGFVLCVDTSFNLAMSPLDTQKYFEKLITEALQTKKSLVIAATKCDKMNQATLEKLQGMLSSSKAKKGQVPIVETSSISNVNVDTVFFLLAEQMGGNKVRFRTKNLPYIEAKRIAVDRKKQSADDFDQLLNDVITECQLTPKQGVEVVKSYPVYLNYVTLCGSNQAKTVMRKHIRKLHDAQVEKKRTEFLETLPNHLSQLVPVVTPSAGIDDLTKDIQSSEQFSRYFVVLKDDTQWEDSPVLTSPDNIIPFQFLKDPEAMRVLQEYMTLAQQQYQHKVAMEKIKSVMETSQLKPSQPLEEQLTSLNLSNELNQLQSREELTELYRSCMKKAEDEALKDFAELLWEHPELFIARTEEQQKKLESSVDDTLGNNILANDPRFQRLHYRGDKCKAEMLTHLALFAVKKGEIKKSAFQEFIASKVPRQEALKVDETSPWVLDITDVYYNIALVGTEHICTNLKNDIMGLCKASRFRYNEVEYQFEFEIFPPTTTELSDESFTPQGVIFIVSSDKLLVMMEKLVKQLFSVAGHYRGLPVAMLYIGEEFMPESNDPLSVQAVRLSRWLQASYIAEKWSVFPDRVLAAESASRLLQGLLERTRHTEAFLRDEMCPEIADMSIAVCTTPDELYNHEELLPPFLANQLAFYKEDRVFQQIHIEEKFYSVAITYHSSTNLESLLSKPLNGFIIVYSSGRKASWKIATFLVSQLPQIPMLLVCVYDVTAGEELVREGETLARDNEYVLFLKTNDYWEPGCLNEFFNKCWFSRFSSMQKQHVKLSKQHSSRALPSRPQSVNVKLRSLPSTPAISSIRPSSSIVNMSAPGGGLGPLQEILTMENGMMDTYDTPDGCVLSKTTTDKRSPARDEPLEYATSSVVRHLMNEQKFRSLPRLPRAPPTGDGDGLYSVASGDRSPDTLERSVSLYSEVSDQTSSSSQHQPVESSNDLYSVVDKSAKKTKPPLNQPSVQPQDIYDKLAPPSDQPSAQPQDIYSVVDKSSKKPPSKQPIGSSAQPQDIYDKLAPPSDQPSAQPQDIYSVVDKSAKKPPSKQPTGSSAQPQDIYSVVDKSAKFRRGKSADQLSLPSVEESQGIAHRPVIKKKPDRRQQQQQHSSSELYSVVEKKNKPFVHEDVYSEIGNPGVATAHLSLNRHQKLPVQEQLYSEVNKPPDRRQQQQQHSSSELYSVVEKKNKPFVHEDVYSEIGNPGVATAHLSLNRHQKLPVQEQLYSVVNKPPVKAKPKRPSPEEIYSEVNKPAKPGQHNSELHNTSTSSENEPTPLRRTKVKPADLYDEVKPQQIENGDIYSVVNKPTKPPPVAKKPDRQRRILSDSSVTMATQEDALSHDSGVEDEPPIPDRCYDDDELELDDEPPELPPRLYSLSDFDTEDELCFDDIMDDFIADRTFENPLYQSIASCKPLGPGGEERPAEDSNPLYQTLASMRKEMDNSKPKTGTLKSTPQSVKNDKIRERLQRQAEKEQARRLKQEERNRKRQEEARKRQEQARIIEEKKLRKKRAGSRKQILPMKPYIPPNEAGGGKYFGLPLLEVCSDDRPIPVYVEQCAHLIEEKGIMQLGIYRVSGKKDDVLQLHAKFDDDPNMDIKPLGVCVNALASGLKSFFKLLPEPLISESVGNQLLTVAKSSDEDQLFKLNEVITEMPSINRKILHFLATHLNKIMQQQEVNKMNASNLAIVFWPTLIRPPIADLADLSKQIDWQLMMTRIIENPGISCDPS